MLLIYQKVLDQFEKDYGKHGIPSFYSSDFLEQRFQSDPSDYAIAFGYAMKCKSEGNGARARQLLARIINSGYREKDLAILELNRLAVANVV